MALLQTTRARTQHSASSVRPTTFRAVLLIAAATANCAVLDVFDSASLATHVNRRSTVQDCSALKLNRRVRGLGAQSKVGRLRGLRSLLGLTSKNETQLPESDPNIVKYAYVVLQELLFHPKFQNDSYLDIRSSATAYLNSYKYNLEEDLENIVYTQAAAASTSTSRTTETDIEYHSEGSDSYAYFLPPVDHHTIISRKSKYFKGKDFEVGDFIFGKMIEENADEQGGDAKREVTQREQRENCLKIYEEAQRLKKTFSLEDMDFTGFVDKPGLNGKFLAASAVLKKARNAVDVALQKRFND